MDNEEEYEHLPKKWHVIVRFVGECNAYCILRRVSECRIVSKLMSVIKIFDRMMLN